MDSRKECLHVQSLLSHRALSIMQKRANSTLLARKARNTTRNLRFQVLAENKVETKWKKLLITEYHYWGSEEEIKNALWLFSFWYSYTNFRESLSPLEGSLSCASKKYNLSSSYVNFSCCGAEHSLVPCTNRPTYAGSRWSPLGWRYTSDDGFRVRDAADTQRNDSRRHVSRCQRVTKLTRATRPGLTWELRHCFE